MNLIDKDKLAERKFVDVENVHILAGRRNGKIVMEKALNNAYKVGWNTAIEAIMVSEPVVEERNKDEWIINDKPDEFADFICPFCNCGWHWKTNFCPDCGADLRGDKND